MRVISGKHRGAVLYEFEGQSIRPTADRAKEAVFNIINDKVVGGNCLDLFCGTGSLGIEAISRGAARVTFVDKSKQSVELTKKNLLKIRENGTVKYSDALKFLNSAEEKFDVVFIDPPYADDVSEKAVELIFERTLLTDDGIIVFERDRPFISREGIAAYDVRRYGKAVISLIRKERKCLFAGTFDPVTVGHGAVVKEASKRYDKVYLTIMNNAEKEPLFALLDRLEMLRLAFKGNPKVTVGYWDGMLVDYMREKGIIYNVRGIRDDCDMEYEKVMEDYNRRVYPEIVYDYIYTENSVSSTEVRRRLKSGESLEGLVDKKVLKYICEADDPKADKKR